MHTNIKDFKVNGKYSGAYIVKSHGVKPTRTGGTYLDMVLGDKTGDISAKLWTIPTSLNVDSIVDGYFIAVALTCEDYQGKLQAKIESIKLITDESMIDKGEILPVAPEAPEKMYADVINTINDIGNSELQKLCLNIVMENKKALLAYPGAKSMHHAELHGLLHHITGMLSLAKAILNVYPNVNSDLLLAGVILHDICKPREFLLGPLGLCVDYTKEGKLLGHISMGMSYVEAKCKELKISSEITVLIMHMLLSHHGEPDFGSAIRPMFIEAILLNMIDNMDAKVNMVSHALEGVEVGGFSEKLFGLNNIQIYNHGLKNE